MLVLPTHVRPPVRWSTASRRGRFVSFLVALALHTIGLARCPLEPGSVSSPGFRQRATVEQGVPTGFNGKAFRVIAVSRANGRTPRG
jgi:hypothetical protein